jgi:hypothetical protein
MVQWIKVWSGEEFARHHYDVVMTSSHTGTPYGGLRDETLLVLRHSVVVSAARKRREKTHSENAKRFPNHNFWARRVLIGANDALFSPLHDVFWPKIDKLNFPSKSAFTESFWDFLKESQIWFSYFEGEIHFFSFWSADRLKRKVRRVDCTNQLDSSSTTALRRIFVSDKIFCPDFILKTCICVFSQTIGYILTPFFASNYAHRSAQFDWSNDVFWPVLKNWPTPLP